MTLAVKVLNSAQKQHFGLSAVVASARAQPTFCFNNQHIHRKAVLAFLTEVLQSQTTVHFPPKSFVSKILTTQA